MTSCSRPTCRNAAHVAGLCGKHHAWEVQAGRRGWRPVADVLPHLHALRGLGWTWRQIADTAGVSVSVPFWLVTGRRSHVRAQSARALLAVPLVPAASSQRGVHPAGTRRRIQALAWMGWPLGEVAARAGVRADTLSKISQSATRPSRRLAQNVARVYDALAHLPGPSHVAAGKARAAGWAPPLAWDDHTIDDPAARPAGIRRKRRAA